MKPRLKSGGTRLSHIPKHLIWCECSCGHNGPLPVPKLHAMPNPPETVAEAVEQAKCSRFGQYSIKDFRLLCYGDGAAHDALRGADVNQGGDKVERLE